jgi:translocation and assembly module TamA
VRSALTLLLLCLSAATRAAGVDVDIEGLNDEQRDAVRAGLRLGDYGKRDISPAELRAAYQQADAQVRQALEPFGYYDVQLDKSLTGDANDGWKAILKVNPGEPAIVRHTRVEVVGDGKNQRRVAAAVENFQPREGARLDHATYEASKAVIETSLRGSGFLDAKALQKRVTVRLDENAADVDLRYESGARYHFGDVRFAGDAPFPESFLDDFIPWRAGGYFNSEQVLNLQQRLVDADYFELVSVAPALDERKDGAVPIDVLLKRDERTVYSGEVY